MQKPPIPIQGLPIEKPTPINPQDKKIVVTDITAKLTLTWLGCGQGRPSPTDTVQFMSTVSEEVRRLLGWD